MEIGIIFVRILAELLSLTVIARVFMSWFRMGPPGFIGRFIIDTSQPILDLAQKVTPKTGMLDLSPIVAILAISILEQIMLSILTSM